MPAVFLGHGSPMNALERNRFSTAWADFGASVPRPRAILVVSAHWYVNVTAVTAMPRPRTIHDFYGFPRELFEVQYPAPGSPELAEEVADVVKPTHVGLDRDSWGIDHGTWSVLVHAFPRADVPGGAALDRRAARPRLPPRARRAAGAAPGARRARRRERERGAQPAALDWSAPDAAFDWARRFDEAARQVLTTSPADMPRLRSHPDYARSVPTPEHFLPLLYVAGLASAARRPLQVLVDGYAYGSLSMAAYTLDASIPPSRSGSPFPGSIPDPSEMPPEDTNL